MRKKVTDKLYLYFKIKLLTRLGKRRGKLKLLEALFYGGNQRNFW